MIRKSKPKQTLNL